MKRIILASIICLAGWPGAQAQTRKQKSFVTHLVTAKVLAERCPSWKVDYDFAAMAGKVFKIQPEDVSSKGRFGPMVRELYKKAQDTTANLSLDEACNSVMITYGPEGTAAKNLMIKVADPQEVLDHVATATFLVDHCPVWRLNALKAGKLLIANNLNINQGEKDFDALVAAYNRAMNKYAGEDEEMACPLATALYGPYGANVKDLVVEK